MAANPYVQGWREWDERYADLVVGKHNWQLAAGGLLIVSIILATGMVWLASRSRSLRRGSVWCVLAMVACGRV